MRVSRTLSIALTTIALPLAIPGAAQAHGPSACVAGPARLAGQDAPHAFDAHGTNGTGAGAAASAVYGEAGDVIGAWISGPSAWEDRTKPQKFVGTLRLEALSMSTPAGDQDRLPLLARYYIAFAGAGGERWVRAVFESPGTWSFAYGSMNGTTFTQEGTTTGSVSMSAGTISIDIPSALLPARPGNGNAASTQVSLARSYLRYPSGANTGALVLVDDASEFCSVQLYEPAPPA